jgi:flavorubredoxin
MRSALPLKEGIVMKALVLYHSQEYGNTKKMAGAVAEGLKEAGCKVVLFNTNEDRFDVSTFPHFDCVAFGSPEYFGYIAGGMKMFVDDHYVYDVHKKTEGIKGKPYALFYSHGGGGRVKSVMMNLFKRVGTQVGEPIGSYGAPNAQVLGKCKDLGKELVAAVKK